jgi:hypothetical protein
MHKKPQMSSDKFGRVRYRVSTLNKKLAHTNGTLFPD